AGLPALQVEHRVARSRAEVGDGEAFEPGLADHARRCAEAPVTPTGMCIDATDAPDAPGDHRVEHPVAVVVEELEGCRARRDRWTRDRAREAADSVAEERDELKGEREA